MDIETRLAATAVGSSFTATPTGLGLSLADFQAVVLHARRLEREGYITVKEHKESHSGNGYIDLVTIVKLQSLD